MDTLEALCHDCLHAEQQRAFRRPVSRRPRAVFLPGDDRAAARRSPCISSPHRKWSSRRRRAGMSSSRLRFRAPAGCAGARCANVPRIMTSWLPAPGAVGVEIVRLNTVLDQIFPGRAVLLDRTGRRDVIRRDTVAEQRQQTGANNFFERRRFWRQRFRRTAGCECRSSRLPMRTDRPSGPERLPPRVAGEDIGASAPGTCRHAQPRASSPGSPARLARYLARETGTPLASMPSGSVVRSSVSSVRRVHKRPPVAERPDSSREPAAGYVPRNCGCRSEPRPRPDFVASTSADTSSGSGPLLPIHVVQP